MADPEPRADDLAPALVCAAREGDEAEVARLLAKGAPVDLAAQVSFEAIRVRILCRKHQQAQWCAARVI